MVESEDYPLIWGPWYGLVRFDPFDCQTPIILLQVQIYSQWLQHPAGMIILIFPFHSACGNAIKPIRSLLTTLPGYLHTGPATGWQYLSTLSCR